MSEYIVSGSFYKGGDNEEIVRCRDCKYAYENESGALRCHGYLVEPWDYYNDEPSDGMEVKPDGFCAWGERNDDSAPKNGVTANEADASDGKVSTMPLKMPSEIKWQYMDDESCRQDADQQKQAADADCESCDTREKLEADIWHFIEHNGWFGYEYEAESYADCRKAIFEIFKEWLDRQAAITERELEDTFLDRADAIITRRELVQRELQVKVDGLIAERDEWKAKAESILNAESDKFASEPNAERYTDCGIVEDDSREKLEADVEEICWGKNDNRYFAQKCYLSSYSIEVDEGNVMANHEGHVLMTVIMHMLDRQEAITRHEVLCSPDERDEQISELQADVEKLALERALYRGKLSTALDLAHEIERLMP